MKSTKKQQGNMIIIAVFVIVVMGMLAASLTRIGWSNQDTLTREYLGTQAWFLAHSGNEWAMTTLFPLDEEDDTDSLDTRCTAINGTAGSDAAEALVTNADMPCEVPDIECISPPDDDSVPDDLLYFKVITTAVCGSADFQVQRVQEVWAKGVKE